MDEKKKAFFTNRNQMKILNQLGIKPEEAKKYMDKSGKSRFREMYNKLMEMKKKTGE